TFAIAASALFGFLTVPIYSISAAHAHDFTEDHKRAELSAALLFYFAVGAIVSPVAVSALIDAYGPASFFGFIAVGHAALVLYGLVRMRRRPSATDRTGYIYAPRTSFLVGRLLGRERKKVRRRNASIWQARRHGVGHGAHPHHLCDPLHQRDQAPGQSGGLSAARRSLCPLQACAGSRGHVSVRHR
ncbi:MAG: hypothetical protein AAFZ02_05450, partial [Pseudomonadota bacterium]